MYILVNHHGKAQKAKRFLEEMPERSGRRKWTQSLQLNHRDLHLHIYSLHLIKQRGSEHAVDGHLKQRAAHQLHSSYMGGRQIQIRSAKGSPQTY